MKAGLRVITPWSEPDCRLYVGWPSGERAVTRNQGAGLLSSLCLSGTVTAGVLRMLLLSEVPSCGRDAPTAGRRHTWMHAVYRVSWKASDLNLVAVVEDMERSDPKE